MFNLEKISYKYIITKFIAERSYYMILDYRITKTQAEWNVILDKFKQSDIYFKFEYLDLYSSQEKTPVLVYLESELGKVAYPFMLKDISYEPLLSDALERNSYFDISTPYGYAGLLLEPNNPEQRRALIELFYSKFSEFCSENNIVSEFIVFSPLLKNYSDMDVVMDCSPLKRTLATNLQDYGDPIYSEVSKSRRKSVSRNKKHNMSIEFELSPKSFERQFEIYQQTMKRKNASEFHLFSKSYFEQILNTLSDNVMIANVFLDNKLIEFELCFLFDKFIHSHLTGTANEWTKYSPSDFSTFEIISWGHQNGYHYLHTGGGFTASDDDTLYTYKKSFAINSEFYFYIGKKIWNQSKYDYLANLKSKSSELNSNFFPLYRSKF